MGRLIFDTRTSEAESKRLSRAAGKGELQKVHPGIFFEPGGDNLILTIRRSWPQIAHHLFPAAVVTDRSGKESQPSTWDQSEDRFIFLSRPGRPDVIQLPGFVFSVRDGVGPVDGEDLPYMQTFIAGPVRRLLDNIMPSRSRNSPSRTIGPAGVELMLDQICNARGEQYLNEIRADARQLAKRIHREQAFQQLDEMISGLLSTREAKLTTDQGRARAAGRPFDPDCLTRLRVLNTYLNDHPVPLLADPNATATRRPMSVFIEAYFSNYIEGTEFAVREAQEIVFEGKIPEARPQDGHDVLATYLKIMESDRNSMSSLKPAEFIDQLRGDHADIMVGRPEISPGAFKSKANQAGGTHFVLPDLVLGTLHAGAEMVSAVRDPFARAIMAHYLVSEVHPFNDGNGRMSRIIMSRELGTSGLSHIVVPTVFRGDYLDSLRALTRRQEPSIFVRSMLRLQEISAACSDDDPERMMANWASTFAFVPEDTHARLRPPDINAEIEWKDDTPAPKVYWAALENDKSVGFGF